MFFISLDMASIRWNFKPFLCRCDPSRAPTRLYCPDLTHDICFSTKAISQQLVLKVTSSWAAPSRPNDTACHLQLPSQYKSCPSPLDLLILAKLGQTPVRATSLKTSMIFFLPLGDFHFYVPVSLYFRYLYWPWRTSTISLRHCIFFCAYS